jgi:TolA-binding protein
MQRKQSVPSVPAVPADSVKFERPKMYPHPTPAEIVKMIGPIFGGTAPAPPDQQAQGQPATVTVTPGAPAGDQQQQSAGGDQQQQNDDPISKLQNDPQAITQLVNQLDKLQKDLSKVSGERDQLTQAQQQAERAQQTREQQLETDLQNAQAQLEKMERVIRTTAITNAFLSNSDYQWNSVRQALAELDDNNYDIDIDLDNGIATVSGMENEVKRIAQASPWLLKNKAEDKQDNNGSSGTRKPASGKPPAPPKPDADKQSKRADLIKKFPVIATGGRKA